MIKLISGLVKKEEEKMNTEDRVINKVPYKTRCNSVVYNF